MSVLHPKAIRDNAKLSKSDPLVQMTGMDVALNNSVELKNFEAYFLRPRHTVKHELLADMLTPAFRADSVARIADVSASSNVVGMQDVQADDLAAFVNSNTAITL